MSFIYSLSPTVRVEGRSLNSAPGLAMRRPGRWEMPGRGDDLKLTRCVTPPTSCQQEAEASVSSHPCFSGAPALPKHDLEHGNSTLQTTGPTTHQWRHVTAQAGLRIAPSKPCCTEIRLCANFSCRIQERLWLNIGEHRSRSKMSCSECLGQIYCSKISIHVPRPVVLHDWSQCFSHRFVELLCVNIKPFVIWRK